ncbi:MAG: hypothetical protein ACI8P9_000396 [Parasphingorhabdus sp.]|jgi:hypothetical protein
MIEHKLDITPTVTVYKLLEAYPELEDVLIGIAPPFKKLKNPILRRSVAKIATLRHASTVGGVPLNHLVNVLREFVGQSPSQEDYEDINYFTAEPDWFEKKSVVLSIDEQKDSKNNEMTLGPILRGAKKLTKGQILELKTSFLPAPGIEVMRSKGYQSWSIKGEGEMVFTYFMKNR